MYILSVDTKSEIFETLKLATFTTFDFPYIVKLVEFLDIWDARCN